MSQMQCPKCGCWYDAYGTALHVCYPYPQYGGVTLDMKEFKRIADALERLAPAPTQTQPKMACTHRYHSSMLEIALILREHLLSEIFVGQSKQVEHLNAVIAQLSARPPAKS